MWVCIARYTKRARWSPFSLACRSPYAVPRHVSIATGKDSGTTGHSVGNFVNLLRTYISKCPFSMMAFCCSSLVS